MRVFNPNTRGLKLIPGRRQSPFPKYKTAQFRNCKYFLTNSSGEVTSKYLLQNEVTQKKTTAFLTSRRAAGPSTKTLRRSVRQRIILVYELLFLAQESQKLVPHLHFFFYNSAKSCARSKATALRDRSWRD